MLYLRILAIAAVVCVRPCDGDDTSVPRYEALALVVQAAHTTDLPAIDRVEIFALSFAEEDGDAPTESKVFLVRPAPPNALNDSVALASSEIAVRSHASRSLVGVDAKRIADDWRSLTFEPNGAFCHVPTYGLRFFRDDKLMFSVSVCWKCHNFYIPAIDSQTGRPSVMLYGFDDNAAAKKLLNDLRRLVPHPNIRLPRLR
ncbi:hypothetical protein K227x_32470 [Rubripirellula lacrimiformis]|uniref:Uncharacterized protein n=1 Tax=Rubripirellula lacrimiformis TaxID=1930273 RepID=A0A517NCK3_9BACT|nr:hypothetical protein K227x_32470 [Rubripirellula lacrimiformis]